MMVRRFEHTHFYLAIALGRGQGGRVRIMRPGTRRAATLFFPGGRIWGRIR